MSTLDSRTPDQTQAPFSVRKLAIMAVFIALSAVGALIKIPSPIGSIGLDSAPGYFVAIAFGGWMGAIVIAIGHLLSAAIVGFPLSLPIHLGVAIGMAICAVVFRVIGKRGTVALIIAGIVAALLNAFAVGLLVLPIGGAGMYAAVTPSLLVASAVNIAIAVIAYLSVRNSKLLA